MSFNSCARCRTLFDASLRSGERRLVAVHGLCNIPASAKAVSVNVAAVLPTAMGYLTLYPGDATAPLASTINFDAGQVRSNNAFLFLSGDGVAAVVPLVGSNGLVDLVIDVNGYFE
jgi:hypothetical protein